MGGAGRRPAIPGFGQRPLRAQELFNESDADIDRLTFSGRLQYVDPTNDQAFSPYFAITPRFSYLPTFSDQTEARQDFNLGFNKSYHLDSSFHLVPVAADTSSDTVWSFGLTSFVQRRLRQPQLSSDALGLIPSASWVISKDWNASVAVEMLGRRYEPDRFGEASHDWEVLPIATLEYIIPPPYSAASDSPIFLGGRRSTCRARISRCGRPCPT